MVLDVRYPEGYPDTLPELTITPLEGELEEEELQHLLSELHKVVGLITGALAGCHPHYLM